MITCLKYNLIIITDVFSQTITSDQMTYFHLYLVATIYTSYLL